MEELKEKHSFEISYEALSFLYIRLRSKPETRTLADPVNAAREQTRERYFSWKDARLQRRAATAEVEELDGDVDDGVMDLSFGVAATDPLRRNAPAWRYLFPKPPSEAMRDVASPEQERYVVEVLQRLEEPAYAPFQEKATRIREALELLKAAQAQRKALFAEEQKARDAYVREHAASCELYNKMPSRLRLGFDFSKRKIETFFLPLSSRKEPDSLDPVVTPDTPSKDS